MPASRTLYIELDALGSFLPFSSNFSIQRVGNYRINSGDKLTLHVPAGAVVNQLDVRLIVRDAWGHVASLPCETDVFGNVSFTLVAEKSGPLILTCEYTPLPVDGETGDPPRRLGATNNLIVEPLMIHGPNREILRPSAICMQTVLSRCLGTIDTWFDKIKAASGDLKYNMIHFTPIQSCGISGSCYSLADQLSVSPEIIPAGCSDAFALVTSIVKKLDEELGILSASDIVLNHTAINTIWLPDHPECGYNLTNSPHLNGACELDVALQAFSVKVARGKYSSKGLPALIENAGHIQSLRTLVYDEVLRPFKMREWFMMDLDAIISDYKAAPSVAVQQCDNPQDRVKQECLKYVGIQRCNGVRPLGAKLREICPTVEDLSQRLKGVQADFEKLAEKACRDIVDSIEGLVRWERLDCRKGPVGEAHFDALTPRYFTPVVDKAGKTHYLANNGWVMNWDATKDFAAPGQLVYLKRDLIAWSDSVKLRYGASPDDCPFLWDIIGKYCTQTASIFHAIRLDNCHSTPMHVAQYFLKACRKANPNLWVFAELFTGSEEADLKFERELGLNALIREAMQTYSARDLATHIEKYGGLPMSTLEATPALDNARPDGAIALEKSRGCNLFFDCTHDNEAPAQKRTAADALPNAVAVTAAVCGLGSTRGYDELVPQNLSVVTERRLYKSYVEAQPSSQAAGGVPLRPVAEIFTALRPYAGKVAVKGSWDGWQTEVLLSKSSGGWAGQLPEKFLPSDPTGSARYEYKFIADGGDWFHDPARPSARSKDGNINNELWVGTPTKVSPAGESDAASWRPGSPLPGIMEARKVLNRVHTQLGTEGFTEVEVSLKGNDVILVTRHNPKTHDRYMFILYTCFNRAALSGSGYHPGSIVIPGRISSVVLEARLNVNENAASSLNRTDLVNGFPSNLALTVDSNGSNSPRGWFDSSYDSGTNTSAVQLKAFHPGSVIVLRIEGFQSIQKNFSKSMLALPALLNEESVTRVEKLLALSYLLYSCSNEELDRSQGSRGCYEIPPLGPFKYAGVAGLVPYLDRLRCARDQSINPIKRNVEDGDWLFNYMADRLDNKKDMPFSANVALMLSKIAAWMRTSMEPIMKNIPRQFLILYYDRLVSTLYSGALKMIIQGMASPLQTTSDPFVRRLLLASLQFYAFVPSSPLIWGTDHPSIAAGLPHFSTGFMRAWGRDTFIALKGILLVTGRYQEAREELLGFARVVRHALVPNLLDSGNNPRYNARDATWWFLQSIQDYCRLSPEGVTFLETAVSLKYLDTVERPQGVTSLSNFADLIHYILTSHARGINFREWNAGTQIDSQMTDPGFEVTIKFDPQTGFILGGNRHNCGTWMDKMGSSSKAGNKGVPATPRDGAAVEIIGLLKSCVSFVANLPSDIFPYKAVVLQDGKELTYTEWNSRLEQSFDRHFFIPADSKAGSHVFDVKLANRRGIYKDSYEASDKWRDYQLRPNFCVALAVAPEMVPQEHALLSLDQASRVLFGAQQRLEMESRNDSSASYPLFTRQLGLKTLDPSDLNYRPRYDNDNDSADKHVAHGWSYHNGPEWVWPVGYFLEAMFKFQMDRKDSTALKAAQFHTAKHLFAHRKFVVADTWLSLPELTNADAEFCPFSCTAQAWSVGTILGYFYDVAAAFDAADDKSSSGLNESPNKREASSKSTAPTEPMVPSSVPA